MGQSARAAFIDKREQVIDPLTAYQITSMLEGVIQRGTGIAIKEVGKHLAGKTGTTNDAKDLWFVGYSPNLAFGVFMGYDKPRSLGGSAQAALYTAPIFRDFMKMALKETPDTPFRIPPGIKLISVDVHTGMRATGSGTMMEAFKPGTGPPDTLRRRRRRRSGSNLVAKRTFCRVWDRRALLSARPLSSLRHVSRSDRCRTRGGTSNSLSRSLKFHGRDHARRSRTVNRIDQAVPGTAEEASLTSMPRRGA